MVPTRRPAVHRILLVLLLGLASLAVTPAGSDGDRPPAPGSSLSLSSLCRDVGGSESICAQLDDTPLTAEHFPGIRTVPDPACPEDYVGPGGMIVNPYPVQVIPEEHTGVGGEPAPPAVVEQLPDRIDLRGTTATFTHDRDFAVHDGRIYTRPRFGDPAETWERMLLPRCLDGQVDEISADGFVLVATTEQREVYTLDFGRDDGWTRRWGAFFWTDLGAHVPQDVTDWDASELHAGFDEYFVDRAGRKQEFWGILMLYLLRGDGTRITYLDPWLPVDDSREICPPERGTVVIEGLSASGSTAMVVTSQGHIYTRLYDFDISGANTVLHDYSWQDQHDVDDPLIQLPAPDWIRHPDVPGRVTDRVSIRKVSPGTEHRIMRIEGIDRRGRTGYWQKDIADLGPDRPDAQAGRPQHAARPGTPPGRSPWDFVPTDAPLRGQLLPTAGPHRTQPEEFTYEGTVDGHPARVAAFHPYCSPTTLEIDLPDGPLDLILHTVDGLRQERRGRGLDLYPRHYRSAIEVPRDVWERRERLPDATRQFLDRHFERRLLAGPLTATLTHLQVQEPCWNLYRVHDDLADALAQPPAPDGGTVVSQSPVLGTAVVQAIRGEPDLAALLAATGDENLGLGVRACPPS